MRERVIDALIADYQHEWRTAATPAGRSWVVARWWASFWIALPACLAHDMRHDIGGVAKRVLGPLSWPRGRCFRSIASSSVGQLARAYQHRGRSW
jgi:hypothetical protein